MSNTIEQLASAFQKLPGVGPRQAKRFVFAILEKDLEYAKTLSSFIWEARNKIVRCAACFYAFELHNSDFQLQNSNVKTLRLCSVCQNASRDNSLLLIVQKEIDLENIEKSRCYDGKYFILGGAIFLLNPIKLPRSKAGLSDCGDKNQISSGINKNGGDKIRMRELFERVKNDKNIKEVILAMNTDREGETAGLYINKILEPFVQQRALKITRFGKGLSSGAEIEYADKDTIQNAFQNRR